MVRNHEKCQKCSKKNAENLETRGKMSDKLNTPENNRKTNQTSWGKNRYLEKKTGKTNK